MTTDKTNLAEAIAHFDAMGARPEPSHMRTVIEAARRDLQRMDAVTDADKAAALVPIEYEIEMRKHRGYESTPLSDKELDTIRRALTQSPVVDAPDWEGLNNILRAMRARNEQGSLYLTNWIEDNRPKAPSTRTHLETSEPDGFVMVPRNPKNFVWRDKLYGACDLMRIHPSKISYDELAAMYAGLIEAVEDQRPPADTRTPEANSTKVG